MPSTREQVLSALVGLLRMIPGAAVKRNEALPERVGCRPRHPARRRSGRAGRDAQSADRVLQPPRRDRGVRDAAGRGGGEAMLDALLAEIGTALAADRSLGGLTENLFWSAPETSVLAIEGAAPILTARITVTIEYLVSDPLTQTWVDAQSTCTLTFRLQRRRVGDSYPPMAARRLFACSRRARAATLGQVWPGRLSRPWACAARRIRSIRRASASSRLAAWVRRHRATMTSTPSPVSRRPASRARRSRTSAGSDGERRTSKRICTAVDSLLTF